MQIRRLPQSQCQQNEEEYDLEQPDHEGNTPAYTAAACNNVIFLKFLYENGCDISKENNKGQNPAIISTENGNIEIMEKNHFLIQTVRIPKNEEPSLKKVCQIALNIGQYQGYTRKTIKNSSIKDYLLNSDCCILLKDILTYQNILELEQLLQK